MRYKKLSAIGFYLAIVLGSVLHGSNKVRKGFLIGVTTAPAIAFSYFLGASWWAVPIGLAGSLAYWFLFRTGSIAKAELDFMYMADRVNVNTIWKAYIIPTLIASAIIIGASVWAKMYWLCLLPLIFFPTIYVPAWASKKYADYNQVGFTPEKERKARSRVELFQALAPSGIYCLLIVLALSLNT